MQDTSQDPRRRAGRSRDKRRVAFTAVALAIPVLFLLLAEAALRLGGFGGYEPLFVPVKRAADFLQPNERVIQRLFSNPAQAPQVSIDTTYFRTHKDPDTLRIFVQGGSTAAGFPYGKWASPAGMLKHRLRRSFPAHDIEVISTAMSAINSYALLDFADEIIAHKPDAVVIYAGHNEYLGVLGVGSTFTSSQSRMLTLALLKLRRIRLYQLVERLVAGDNEPAAERNGTLMARIAGERRIAFGSDLYTRGLDQFEGNLDALLARYASAGIPVLVGTLASNEGDRPPFTSVVSADSDGTGWQRAYDAGIAALEVDRAAEAVDLLDVATTLDDGAADAWYALGHARRSLGDAPGARDAFQRARDRDQLRFRAPGAFNDIIRRVARKHSATVIEVEKALAAESDDGIIGNNVMLEHLHPNVRGYFVLADAFFDAIGRAGLIGPWDQAIDDVAAWRTQPVTEIDALAAGYRLDRLLADWPFQQIRQPFTLPPATTAQQQIAQAWYTGKLSWPDAMNRALVYYQQSHDLDNAVRVALNLAEAFHFLANVQYIAGRLLGDQGDHALAQSYLERAVQLEPRPDYQLALAQAYRDAQRPQDARRLLGTVLAREPDNAAAQDLLRTLQDH